MKVLQTLTQVAIESVEQTGNTSDWVKITYVDPGSGRPVFGSNYLSFPISSKTPGNVKAGQTKTLGGTFLQPFIMQAASMKSIKVVDGLNIGGPAPSLADVIKQWRKGHGIKAPSKPVHAAEAIFQKELTAKSIKSLKAIASEGDPETLQLIASLIAATDDVRDLKDVIALLVQRGSDITRHYVAQKILSKKSAVDMEDIGIKLIDVGSDDAVGKFGEAVLRHNGSGMRAAKLYYAQHASDSAIWVVYDLLEKPMHRRDFELLETMLTNPKHDYASRRRLISDLFEHWEISERPEAADLYSAWIEKNLVVRAAKIRSAIASLQAAFGSGSCNAFPKK